PGCGREFRGQPTRLHGGQREPRAVAVAVDAGHAGFLPHASPEVSTRCHQAACAPPAQKFDRPAPTRYMRDSARVLPTCGAVAQLGERLNGIQEVEGSTPFGSTPAIPFQTRSPVKSARQGSEAEGPGQISAATDRSIPARLASLTFLLHPGGHTPQAERQDL